MAGYDKKIIYLSYMELGNKLKSAGFVKREVQNDNCNLDMHLSGMNELADGKYDIAVVGFSGEEYILDKIYIYMGCGEWKDSYQNGTIGVEGVRYTDAAKLIVKISETKWIEGSFGNVMKDKEERKAETVEIKEKKLKDKERHNNKTDMPTQEQKIRKSELKAGSIEEKGGLEENYGIKMENVILDDKWEQLCQIYPTIHPYEDDRVYITIQPKDFVIMTGDYQHLANNSFLLHGFYNYRHIILGKEDDFYLGVPGVYYEREKMVALMFGFEAFECNGGKAEAGKFGYYLRRVKI